MAASSDQVEPHCYGPINLPAIVDVMELSLCTGSPVPASTMAMLRQYRVLRLAIEAAVHGLEAGA